jgi:hypothetical protein
MGCIRLVGEHAFEDCFIDMVNRVLVVKKGITVASQIESSNLWPVISSFLMPKVRVDGPLARLYILIAF